jgi:Flp pilus assembly protein CpaB
MRTIALAAAALAVLAAGAARADDAQGFAPLAPGYRGIAIPLPGTQLAFVKKGDRVDVVVEYETAGEGGAKEKVAATVLQNVLVVDVRRPDRLEQLGAAEILVFPIEAEYAALSLAQGEVHLSVRAAGDKEMKPTEPASFRKLFK